MGEKENSSASVDIWKMFSAIKARNLIFKNCSLKKDVFKSHQAIQVLDNHINVFPLLLSYPMPFLLTIV